MNRLIITRLEGRLLTALMDDMKAVQMDFEDQEPSILGNIYIGKVRDVVKNINAAFVDLGGGVTGYYSLDANPVPIRASHAAEGYPETEDMQTSETVHAASSAADGAQGSAEERPKAPATDHRKAPAGERPRPLRPGDEIVVQVSKDAVKSKDPVLSAELTLTGRLCVLSYSPAAGKNYIRFSTKITDSAWKKQITDHLRLAGGDPFGLIVRTNAFMAEPEQIRTERDRLAEEMNRILHAAPHQTCYSLLYEEAPPYAARLRDYDAQTAGEILTDDEEIFRSLTDSLDREQPDLAGRLRLYRDPLVSLASLYSLEKNLRDALQKRVWLTSGAYLVIEQTEAMTVIDVNTGKYTGAKAMRDTVRMINLEAAKETARQLRLRNLSGIIMVDFINMETAEDRSDLMHALTEYCRHDPVKTTVVDMTRLGLVEITRKKTRKPLSEQWR